MAALAKQVGGSAAPMDCSSVKRLWYSAMDPTLHPRTRESNLDLVEREMEAQVEFFLSREWLRKEDYVLLGSYGHFQTFFSMAVSRCLVTSYTEGPDIKNPIVIPVMAHGMPFGAAVASELIYHGQKPDTVLLGYSHVRPLEFSDGSLPEEKVYVPGRCLEFLEGNKGRQVIIVDDVIDSGCTLLAVESFLKGLGFSEIYQITGNGLQLSDVGEAVSKRKSVPAEFFGPFDEIINTSDTGIKSCNEEAIDRYSNKNWKFIKELIRN